jgi:hypothetical protein
VDSYGCIVIEDKEEVKKKVEEGEKKVEEVEEKK